MKKGLLTFTLFLLLLAPARAAEISGVVRSVEHFELSGATIQLRHVSSILEEHLLSASGRFEFRNLDPGSYIVGVRAQGYRDQDVSVVIVRQNSREVVQLELVPLDLARASGTGVVSVYDMQVPSSARSQYSEGLKQKEKGGCAKAVPHFEKALATFAQYADAHNEMGKCLQEAQRIQQAEEAFQKAILYGSSIFPFINLADLYSSQNRPDDAQLVLFTGISRFPGEGDLKFALAKNLFDRGRLAEAEEAGLDAHSKLHRSADVHLLLAKVYLAAENYASVVSQLKLYLEENPKGALADRVRQNLADIEGK